MKNYGKSSLNYPFCSLSEALNYINLFYSVSDYLLSNNHINAIIVHKFDFSDEEVCILFPVNIFSTLNCFCNGLFGSRVGPL